MILFRYWHEWSTDYNQIKKINGKEFEKKFNKTLQLIEFLMKNGSIEFVAVMAEKFKCYVEPYVYYEFIENYED